jgi:hypothetical protein
VWSARTGTRRLAPIRTDGSRPVRRRSSRVVRPMPSMAAPSSGQNSRRKPPAPSPTSHAHPCGAIVGCRSMPLADPCGPRRSLCRRGSPSDKEAASQANPSTGPIGHGRARAVPGLGARRLPNRGTTCHHTPGARQRRSGTGSDCSAALHDRAVFHSSQRSAVRPGYLAMSPRLRPVARVPRQVGRHPSPGRADHQSLASCLSRRPPVAGTGGPAGRPPPTAGQTGPQSRAH